MKALVHFTLRQQVLFNLVFALGILVGVMALGQITVERYPDVNMGKVQVATLYPGASPEDVEALVTRKIEESLEGLEEVEFIQSSSVRERSIITLKFRDDTDYDALYNQLRFRVLGILDELPEMVEPPVFTQWTTGAWLPVVVVNLVGERSNRALALMAEQLRAEMSRIPGVSEARVSGDWTREFHIWLDPAKLARFGITFDQVASALRDANQVIPAGDFSDGSGEFVVRVDERFRDSAQVAAVVVRADADGSFVRLGDLISRAELGYRDPFVIRSVSGQDAVALSILKTTDGDALKIHRAVREILATAAPRLAALGVEAVLTQDSTTYVVSSISTLGWNMIVGMLLVGVLLWLFMGPRNAGLVSLGIPFSFLLTITMTWLTGNTLNEITLFSFVLVSGILVDDAIVVVENIYRHIQDGEPLEQAIVDGTAEVMPAVIAATATTVAAFLPMLMMTGSTGEFFAQIPKAISFAIIASLFECIFILPLHYRDFGPRPVGSGGIGGRGSGPVQARDRWLLNALIKPTQRLLAVTLRFRWLTLGTVGLAFVLSIAILGVSVSGVLPLIRIKFFPDDYNLYYVFVEGPPDTPLARVDEKVRAISTDLLADGPGYVDSVAAFAGFTINEDYEEVYGRYLGTVMVSLPRTSARAFSDPLAHLEDIRARMIATHGGGDFKIRVRAEKDGPPSGKDVNIQVVGHNDRDVAGLADALAAGLSDDPSLAPYLTDLDAGRAAPARVLRFNVNAERAGELGLTQGQAIALAASVLDGRYLGKFRLPDEEIDIKLGLDPGGLERPEDALATPVLEDLTGPVRLGDVVRLSHLSEPSELRRYQGLRSRVITANLATGAPISAATVVAWAREREQALSERYPGAHLIFGGGYEDTQRSFQSLMRAFFVAILLIYLILAVQFRSYAQPALILSAVMFAIIGVVFGKLLTQSLFTVNSFIAVVGVTGVVINDALVLLEFINRRYRAGQDRRSAIRESVSLRLRPIVLTTLTTSLGLLPMAIGFPSYSVIWGTMASTFVTGLATATLLTIFVVPVAWDLLTEWQEKTARK
ncbi:MULTISPECIES: efflux RND transporter permease subunit [Thiorhodovibrio]|uniref:efflux RND transporter permease subunit n=1 Tax=Thiorhodovibrio TaxID=61593 RepID=UPI00191490F8|nr:MULTISPECIES: efflux RND transporter permease subunit [Thiorhodovibrio]MBK5970945.1 acriflavin resistance protein [Thiorhodovibrio winogradskyi]WPL10689.1 putative efflux pump membrane transporter TtgB [Thiorhodovibrio litoralis]